MAVAGNLPMEHELNFTWGVHSFTGLLWLAMTVAQETYNSVCAISIEGSQIVNGLVLLYTQQD